MGRCPNHKKSKKKGFSHKSARRAKFLAKGDDIIYHEVSLLDGGQPPKPTKLDEDLPGMGQFYCLHCDRYFLSSTVRDEHFKSKKHKKRLKMMKGDKPHCQLDAEIFSGMGKPDNGPSLRSNDIPMGL